MQHTMSLSSERFLQMAAGTKTVECRLYDTKRQGVHVGDTITFANTKTGETLRTEVTGITQAPSFSRLFTQVDPVLAGWSSAEAAVAGMRGYYTEEREQEYGVIALHVQVLAV
jgi:ASC-1-like (ASCH) protein